MAGQGEEVAIEFTIRPCGKSQPFPHRARVYPWFAGNEEDNKRSAGQETAA